MSVLDRESTEAYLDRHEHKDLLRFITCGSVDDGKSTLVGRILFEAQLVLDDQMRELEKDSRRFGTQGEQMDLALLVDGLAAEREQGITIDVAYRFFATSARKFVVADTPGHEQYTRNMVTGASTAQLAVILVDARSGITDQTRRHTFLMSLIGVRKVVLAVNKMDLVGYAAGVAQRVEAEFLDFTRDLGFSDVLCVPMSALAGDNVVEPSPNTPWYTGPPLLRYLETVPTRVDDPGEPFRMPVQSAIRPGPHFRGYAGTVSRGTVRPGDEVTVLPSGLTSRVGRIVTADGDRAEAGPGNAVCLTLTDDIDVSRGCVLAATGAAPEVADQFAADLVWMAEGDLVPSRSYLMKTGHNVVTANVTRIRHTVDIHTLQTRPAATLGLNDVAHVQIALNRPVPFEPYREHPTLGSFILIDRVSGDTAAAGMIRHALRRSANLHPQPTSVGRPQRERLNGHRGGVVWLTGLSGTGKSAVADRVEQRLRNAGVHTYLLDGENVRLGMSRDLGFTEADRAENTRRVGEVAGLMADAGLVVVVCLISPYRSDRERAREMAGGTFYEVFVDLPLELARERDLKGLYAKARSGVLPNFTGVDSGYETPLAPELHLDMTDLDVEAAATAVISRLREDDVIPG